jgi:hypothetical protein
MARVKSKTLRFNPSVSTDVTEYLVYFEPAASPTKLSYESTVASIGKPEPGADGKIAVDMSQFEIIRTIDGKYDVGLTVVDDGGNESSMAQLLAVELDFTAPDAPTGLQIV